MLDAQRAGPFEQRAERGGTFACAPVRAPSMPRSRSTAVPSARSPTTRRTRSTRRRGRRRPAGGTSPARTKRSRCCRSSERSASSCASASARRARGVGFDRARARARARAPPGAPRASRRCASSAPAIVAASGNASVSARCDRELLLELLAGRRRVGVGMGGLLDGVTRAGRDPARLLDLALDLGERGRALPLRDLGRRSGGTPGTARPRRGGRPARARRARRAPRRAASWRSAEMRFGPCREIGDALGVGRGGRLRRCARRRARGRARRPRRARPAARASSARSGRDSTSRVEGSERRVARSRRLRSRRAPRPARRRASR